jgi:hypothetical protein
VKLRIFLIFACLVVASGLASAANSFNLCGTGFSNNTCTAQANTTGTGVDANFVLESAPTIADGCSGTCATPPATPDSSVPVTTSGQFPFGASAWTADTTGTGNGFSEWISPHSNQNSGNSDPWSASVPYVYTETFIIPVTINPGTVVIIGEWTADNYGSILVNGNAVTTGVDGALANVSGNFMSFTAFTLDGSATGTHNASSLKVGSNTITFDVFNNANGTPDVSGVDVVISSATGQNASPEPATLGIVGLGLVALGLSRKKWKR